MRWRDMDYGSSGFAGQFEPNGDGYLYRKRMRDAPIPVSAAERDQFVADFRKARTRWVMGFFVTLLTFCIWLGFYVPEAADFIVSAGAAIAMVIFWIVWLWLWDAPSRKLRARSPVGVARSREEATRVRIGQITYNQFAIMAAAVAWMMWRYVDWAQWSSGKNLAWIGLGAVLIAILGYRVFQKWSFDKERSR